MLNHLHSKGVSLLEVLVSVFVLSIATLAILYVQIVTLADASDAIYRGQAIHLIEDLSERVKSNGNGVNSYAKFVASFSKTAPTFKPCTTQCSNDSIAETDRNVFLQQVNARLPGGQAAIFISTTDKNQLGVMVGWNESQLTKKTSTTETNPFAIASGLAPSSISCPSSLRCHLMYIQAR